MCCLSCSRTMFRAPGISPAAGLPSPAHPPGLGAGAMSVPISHLPRWGHRLAHPTWPVTAVHVQHFFWQGFKIPWMHLNRNRLGGTYICCHIPHFWERCKCCWGAGAETTLWDLPLKAAGSWWQLPGHGESVWAARRGQIRVAGEEGCSAPPKCKKMRQGKVLHEHMRLFPEKKTFSCTSFLLLLT